MSTFDCLYFLENQQLYIIEVKRTGIPEHSTADEKFKWLKIDRETLEVQQLNFRSMDSSGQVEERYFEEGFLKFNANSGTYIEKYNSGQHQLENMSEQAPPKSVIDAIGMYVMHLQETS